MRTFSLVRSFVCSAATCTCASDHATCFVNLRARAEYFGTRRPNEPSMRPSCRRTARVECICGYFLAEAQSISDFSACIHSMHKTHLRRTTCDLLSCTTTDRLAYFGVTAEDSRRVHKSSLFDGPFSPLVFVGVSVVCTDRVSYSAREMQCIAVPVIQESRLLLRLTTLVHDRPISAV